MARFPPAGEIQQKPRAQNRSRPHPETHQQAQPDRGFDQPSPIANDCSMRQNDPGDRTGRQKRTAAFGDEMVKVSLESAASKALNSIRSAQLRKSG